MRRERIFKFSKHIDIMMITMTVNKSFMKKVFTFFLRLNLSATNLYFIFGYDNNLMELMMNRIGGYRTFNPLVNGQQGDFFYRYRHITNRTDSSTIGTNYKN